MAKFIRHVLIPFIQMQLVVVYGVMSYKLQVMNHVPSLLQKNVPLKSKIATRSLIPLQCRNIRSLYNMKWQDLHPHLPVMNRHDHYPYSHHLIASLKIIYPKPPPSASNQPDTPNPTPHLLWNNACHLFNVYENVNVCMYVKSK